MKKVRTQIMLDKDIKDALYEYADKHNISMGRVVREAVKQYTLTKKIPVKKQKKGTGAGDFLLESSKRLRFKGPKDLSQNIDKYVYGI